MRSRVRKHPSNHLFLSKKKGANAPLIDVELPEE